MARRIYIFAMVVTTLGGISLMFLSKWMDGTVAFSDSPKAQEAAIVSLDPVAKFQYRCEPHAPEIPNACVSATPAVAEMTIAAAEAERTEPNWADVQRAMARAMEGKPQWLKPQERVFIQNAALRVALSAKERAEQKSITAPSPALIKVATSLIKHVALPSQTLTSLGSKPVEGLRDWMGEDFQMVDSPPSPHISNHRGTRYYRSVETPSRRAIFSQLAAIDNRGQVHLTPFLGDLVVRDKHNFCAAVMEASYIHCRAPAALKPLSSADDVAFQGMGDCRQCHQSWIETRPPRDPIADSAIEDRWLDDLEKQMALLSGVS